MGGYDDDTCLPNPPDVLDSRLLVEAEVLGETRSDVVTI